MTDLPIDPTTGEIKLRAGTIGLMNYDVDKTSEETGLTCPEPTMAKQEFLEETDINTIVKRFGITGQLPQNLQMPITDDFVDITDYHTALNTIKESQREFLTLPAHIRAEFQNDPGNLIRFLEDPANHQKAIALGIVKAPPAAPPEPPGAPGGPDTKPSA